MAHLDEKEEFIPFSPCSHEDIPNYVDYLTEEEVKNAFKILEEGGDRL